MITKSYRTKDQRQYMCCQNINQNMISKLRSVFLLNSQRGTEARIGVQVVSEPETGESNYLLIPFSEALCR